MCALTACSEEKGPKNDGPVRLDDPKDFKKEYHAEQLGSGITFTAEGSWTASVSAATKAAGADAWIDIDPKSGGAGANTLRVSLQPNLTGKDREASITISCLGSQTTFVVKQTAAMSDGEVPGIYYQSDESSEWLREMPDHPRKLAVRSVGGVVLTLDTLRRIADMRPESLDMGQAVYEFQTFPSAADPREPNWSPEREVDLSSLSSVVLPSNVRRLGVSAFSGSELQSIELLTIDSIGRGAFGNCKQLKSIGLHASLRAIGESAFEGSGLQEITLPGSVLSVGAYAFMNSALTTLNVGNASDTLCIGDMAFYNCEFLRTLNLGNREVHIRPQAFQKCIDLREADLRNATQIGESAFEECTLLSKVTLGAVERLGDRAFAICPALSDVVLGEGLKVIEAGAFKNCGRLQNIVLPASLQRIGQYAFEACDLQNIEFPENVDSLGTGLLDNNANLRSITFKTAKLRTIPDRFVVGNKALEMLTLPESVTRIGESAFFGCQKLGWISLGSELEYIGGSALSSCPLLDAIICRAATPPTCGDDLVFAGSGTGTGARHQCQVPAASVNAYKADAVWSTLEKYQNFSIFGIAEEE